MKVVLDTNVLVSALISPLGKPSRILQYIVGRQIDLLMDERIIYEYRDVLNRPEFGFSLQDVDELLSFLDRIAEYVTPPPYENQIPDKDDLPFLEVALEGRADTLITGNKRDFGKPPLRLRILTPAEFIDFYRQLV